MQTRSLRLARSSARFHVACCLEGLGDSLLRPLRQQGTVSLDSLLKGANDTLFSQSAPFLFLQQDGLKPEEPQSKSDAELADAETAVSAVKSAGSKSTLSSIMEVATLIFIAEWGDRSMLATIALGASQNPLGVAAGAILGHVLATAIAVVVGAIACKYVSERTINVISGRCSCCLRSGRCTGCTLGSLEKWEAATTCRIQGSQGHGHALPVPGSDWAS